MKDSTKIELIEAYLEWANDYLSVPGYADLNHLSVRSARCIIEAGRALNEEFMIVDGALLLREA